MIYLVIYDLISKYKSMKSFNKISTKILQHAIQNFFTLELIFERA